MPPHLPRAEFKWTDVHKILSMPPAQNSPRKIMAQRAVDTDYTLKKLQAASFCLPCLLCFSEVFMHWKVKPGKIGKKACTPI